MFEHTVIHLHKTFPSSVIKIFQYACIDETLYFTFPSSVLAFCILQKAADRFSPNSAAAYRSFFSLSLTPFAVCSISSHKTLILSRFVLHSLTNL